MAGARRQVDDGKGGQWRSVAISRVRILLVNKHFVFRSNRNFGAGIGGENDRRCQGKGIDGRKRSSSLYLLV